MKSLFGQILKRTRENPSGQQSLWRKLSDTRVLYPSLLTGVLLFGLLLVFGENHQTWVLAGIAAVAANLVCFGIRLIFAGNDS